jgi:GDP-4-dehydro-6-deoxy-D-mannose reductase
MKALITGITGFAGSHLADHLLEQGFEVFGTARTRSRMENIEAIKGRITLFDCDITDPSAVRAMFKKVTPNYVFHLAALSFVPSSWRLPSATFVTNVVGQLNLLEAIREANVNPHILVAGSSEEYGKVRAADMPITEAVPLKPLSPYGVSKVAQDLMGFQYHQSYGINILRTRAFNHTGPRRGEVFATSDFARQIALIEAKLKPPVMEVGNLKSERDFTDVRDTVKAYRLVLEKGKVGEVYNVASGKGWKIEEVLNILLAKTDATISVRPDQARFRPSDVLALRGDASKLTQQTGWKPTIEFGTTLADLLDYWRERVERERRAGMLRV